MLNRKSISTLLLILFYQFSFSQTILFEEDFGSTLSGSKWCSMSPATVINAYSCYSGNSWATSSSGKYIKTIAISIPSGTTNLTFDYSYFKFYSFPDISIASSCSGAYSVIKTLEEKNCFSETVDLSLYAGQTIHIQFKTNGSFLFYLDNLVVTNTAASGGGGSSCPFEDDFTSSSINTTNWPSKLGTYTTSSTSCDGGDYSAYLSTSSYSNYAQTKSIDISSASSAELTFNYYMSSSAYNFQCADLLISTDGGSSFTNLNLPYEDPDGTCKTMTFDLAAYIGNQIVLKFKVSTTSYTFYWDEFKVCISSGGGIDLKWADNFNDNNLNLDYAGNDGNEQYAGQSWNIGTASLVSGSQTVNYTQTEAFSSSQPQGYSIQIDKGEYFESPIIDLSAQEGFKISFYVDVAGGGYSDWFGSHVDLKIWNGSSWVLAMQLDGNSSDSEDLMASGFGYHCYTAYKSSTSPGNYYPNLDINSAFFHSGFKFRIEIQGWGTVSAHIDNVTFRADDNGEVLIPCGVSYWNAPEAIHYGRDATATSNAHRGMELEINDLYNVGSPPDWSGHCNDGNTANGTQNTIVWAAISEQNISTARAKVMFIHSDGTGIENVNMSIDNTYSGPGYLYYLKEFSQCNSTDANYYDTGQGLEYHFLFEYGSDFRPVFYHLNATGIEAGGGQTDLSENNNPQICDVWLPVELIYFEGKEKNKQNVLSWSTASEINNSHFEIEHSTDGINFKYIGQVEGHGNSNQILKYEFIDNNPEQGYNYYRLQQIDFDGVWENLNTINIINDNNNIKFTNLKNKTVRVEFSEQYSGSINIYDTAGRLIIQKNVNLIQDIEIPILEKGIFIIQFNNIQEIFTKKLIIQ